jgi:hypothetical protein
VKAQPADCIFSKPLTLIDFGSGDVQEVNTELLGNYWRVKGFCPTDGHYAYTSFTGNCFRGDWHTLSEDHTPGDVEGNMMLVNGSPVSGRFLTTAINGLKAGFIYEFSVWMMNLCKITEKCPFPLLPNITIRLQTPAGKTVAQFNTGNLVRLKAPRWTKYHALFTMPGIQTALTLIMIDNSPGGCGNDFALDDITFRECEKQKPVLTSAPKVLKEAKAGVPVVKQQTKTPQLVTKKNTPVKRGLQTIENKKLQKDSLPGMIPVSKQGELINPPTVLVTRANPVIKKIKTEAGEIRLDLYDNGQIDGDTVSIYHNNKLLVSHAELSQKPISLLISVSPEQPHHELIMVAENLGSIPPNTSLMIVTAGTKRYEVFISSTKQKNAKIILDLEQ